MTETLARMLPLLLNPAYISQLQLSAERNMWPIESTMHKGMKVKKSHCGLFNWLLAAAQIHCGIKDFYDDSF